MRLTPIGIVEHSEFSNANGDLEMLAIKGIMNDLALHPEGAQEIEKVVGLNTKQALGSLLESASRFAVDGGSYFLEDKGVHRIPKGCLTWRDDQRFNEHSTFELKYIWTIRKSNPKLFKVLASLVHYLITKCGVCIFSENLLYLVDPEQEMSDDEEEEADYVFLENFREYDKGEPAKAAKYFKQMKPLSLSKIRSYKTKSKELNAFISDLVTAIECGVRAYANQIDFAQYEEGCWLQEVFYLSWDLDSEVEQKYCEYLNDSAGQVGVHAQYEISRVCENGWQAGEGLHNLYLLVNTISKGFKLIQNLESIKD
ncbi:MAG: hypothetical protein ABJH04_07870 [Cyclobacteriaceae bacterium]